MYWELQTGLKTSLLIHRANNDFVLANSCMSNDLLEEWNFDWKFFVSFTLQGRVVAFGQILGETDNVARSTSSSVPPVVMIMPRSLLVLGLNHCT